MSKLISGVQSFQSNEFPQRSAQFQGLASGQSPKALFITCSDSRISPNTLTSTEPGELFVIRNAGNIVPDSIETDGVLATIEYAVSALKVPEIIVCGHSHCGAMGAVMDPDSAKSLPIVSRWLHDESHELRSRGCVEAANSVWDLVISNVKLQIERLRKIACVNASVEEGRLVLSGWCYEFETGEVFVVNEQSDDLLAASALPNSTTEGLA